MRSRNLMYKYTSRIQKGGALLQDMRLLVRAWRQGETWEEQLERGLASNILGKVTRTRASDVFRTAFFHRFIKGDPPEAWKIVRSLEDRNVGLDILKPIYYWITARSERLLYDFVADFISGQNKSLNPHVRTEDATRWVSSKLSLVGQKWAPTVVTRVTQGLLAALRDFGILEGRSRKRIAPIYLPVEAFAFIAFLLNQRDASGSGLIQHPDWQLFLFPPSLVEKLFLEAHQHRFLRYDAAGNLHRIEFAAKTVEEMANVVAGRAA